ncbi:hypothetical protein [Amycolatopsis sp.]|uniref:hypothetical protein n=1 Tax=Amycolatopsis sp. TaxID=37632 RepID=UPI002D7F8F80|nr:hypothetical protein [Amycolatopsis sp.]HET6708219.1 hypothetical protein [Amycolatopsis sp.]
MRLIRRRRSGGRAPERGRALVTWSALALSPLILLCWTGVGGSPYGLPLLVVALPLLVLARRPGPALGVLLAELVVIGPMPLPEYRVDIRYLLIVGIDLAVGYLAAARSPRVSAAAAVTALAVQVVVGAVFELWPGTPGPAAAKW